MVVQTSASSRSVATSLPSFGGLRRDPIRKPRNPTLLHVRSHLLQVLDDDEVCIHEAVDAVLHAGLLASVQLARGNLAGDALAETGVCEGVDGYTFLVSQDVRIIPDRTR